MHPIWHAYFVLTGFAIGMHMIQSKKATGCQQRAGWHAPAFTSWLEIPLYGAAILVPQQIFIWLAG